MNYDNTLGSTISPSAAISSPGAHHTSTLHNVVSEQKEENSVPVPQSLGGVFDQAVDIYKANFIPLILIVALAMLPIQILLQAFVAKYLHPALIQINAQGEDADPGVAIWIYFGYFCTGNPRYGIPGLISFLLPLLLNAPIAVAVGDIYFGRAPSIKHAYLATLRKLFPILGGITLATLCSVVILVIWGFLLLIVDSFLIVFAEQFLALFHVAVEGSPVIGVFFLLTLLTPYFVLFLFVAYFFTFMIPVTLLEDSSILYASQRTSLLVGKKRFWRTWFALLCLPIFTYAIQGVLIYACNSAIGLFALAPEWLFLVQTSISAATSCFIQPYWMIFITLLYFDYRIQRECFDLRMLAVKEPQP